MSMTLLEVITEFCQRTGLEAPLVICASTDLSALQFKGLANEVITDITGRGNSWPLLQKQATWTSPGTAGGSQGTLATLFPYGFKYIIPATAYDRTDRRILFGPKSPQLWQESLALPFTGPFYAYRIWQGSFYIQPDLEIGHTIALEYASDWAIQATAAGAYKRRFTADTDVFVLDEEMLLMGLRWKWKKEKGLTFVTEKLEYESYLAQCMGNDGTKGELNMNGPVQPEIKPGIWVSAGNWPL